MAAHMEVPEGASMGRQDASRRGVEWPAVRGVWLGLCLGLGLAVGACRIERIERTEDAAVVTLPESLPTPPRYSTDEEPLTPLRTLLQGALAVQANGEADRPRPKPALPGLQVLVLAPDAQVAQKAATRLCTQLRSGQIPRVAVVEAMVQAECAVMVDPSVRREALLAGSSGQWGAAVAVAPELSALTAADWSMRHQMGLLVWGEFWTEAQVLGSPRGGALLGYRELACTEMPPLMLAMVPEPPPPIAALADVAESAPAGASEVSSKEPATGPAQTSEAAAGSAQDSTGSQPQPGPAVEAVPAVSAENEPVVSAGQGPGGDETPPASSVEPSLQAGATEGAADEGQPGPTGEKTGELKDMQDAPQKEVRPPQVAFVGVRTAHGEFLGAIAARSSVTARRGAVGQVALPARRMLVGSDGIVVVDPAMDRQVVPDPLAALRVYEELAKGHVVEEKDVVALLPEGPQGLGRPFMAYRRFDPDDAAVDCHVEEWP